MMIKFLLVVVSLALVSDSYARGAIDTTSKTSLQLIRLRAAVGDNPYYQNIKAAEDGVKSILPGKTIIQMNRTEFSKFYKDKSLLVNYADQIVLMIYDSKHVLGYIIKPTPNMRYLEFLKGMNCDKAKLKIREVFPDTKLVVDNDGIVWKSTPKKEDYIQMYCKKDAYTRAINFTA